MLHLHFVFIYMYAYCLVTYLSHLATYNVENMHNAYCRLRQFSSLYMAKEMHYSVGDKYNSPFCVFRFAERNNQKHELEKKRDITHQTRMYILIYKCYCAWINNKFKIVKYTVNIRSFILSGISYQHA